MEPFDQGISVARPGGRARSGGVGAGTFIGLLDFDFDLGADDTVVSGQATLAPGMCFEGGRPRPSVLLTLAHCFAGGAAVRATTPSLAVTLDAGVHVVAEPTGPHLDLTATVVKRGRSTVAAEVRFRGAGTDRLVASGFLTFMASPRPQDLSPPVPGGMHVHGDLAVGFARAVGVEERGPGVVEVQRRPFVEQASGSVQGGVVALLGEAAAESLTGQPVLDLDVRFLSGVRAGPGRGTATALGGGLVRVEVRDVGHGHRLAALAVARVAQECPS